MNKKFTYLMVMAVMLLSLPLQAQHLSRKQVAAPKMKVMKGVQSASQVRASFQQQPAALVKPEKPVKTPLKAERQVFKPYAFGSMKAPQRIFRASGDVVDEHGIIVTPAEGVRQVYSRSGMMYVNENGMQTLEQSGNVHIVECEDGTVYIRNILASYPTGTWVKGVREGNTITLAARQPIYWNPLAEVTFSFGWGIAEYTWGSLSFSYYSTETVTFIVDDDEKTITLQNPMDDCFLGLWWDDDDAFANFGDFNTVWSYVGEYEPMQTVIVEAPVGMTIEQWYVRGHKTVNGERQVVKGTVNVGFADDEVYVRGFFPGFPEGWMKGTVNEGVATFDGLQQQGSQDGQAVYGVGCVSGDLMPFQMTYDDDQQVLTSLNELLANTSVTDVVAVDSYDDITITSADPFAPIETFPYINAIGSQDEFEWFTVVDANEDGRTWQLFDEDGTWKASNPYNGDEAADDWLISPAFKLEAGKTYSMAIDMNGSSDYYDELFEVKMGKEATAEAMTTEVIPQTVVNSEMAITYQNKLITVAETGIYYFGIHAISPADQASLRASNLVVDETILNAPQAVTDLALTANSETGTVSISFTAPTKNIGGNDLTDDITVTIVRNGDDVVLFTVAPGAPFSYDDENLGAGKYNYTITTSNSFGRGESVTGTATLTAVCDVPYVADFSEDGVYDQFTAINANDDASYWENNVNYAAYEYNSSNDADDYLISPGLKLEGGKQYVITVDAEAAGSFPERFEVLLGKEPSVEGLTATVIEPTVITGDEGRMTYEGTFSCEESGIYYASVHAISDADMYILQIYKLAVEVGPEPTAPNAPGLTVTPGEKGTLAANVSITVPTISVDGNALTDNLTKVEILRDDEVVKEFEDMAPGAMLSYTDEEIESSGFYTYQLIPYNASGIGKKSEKVKVYIGMDVPMDVANVKTKDQLTSVMLSWDKVGTVGEKGGYVDPTEVTYNIWACEPNSTWLMDEPVASVKDADQYELEYNTNEGEQGYQAWVVTAANDAGESYQGTAQLVTLTVGKPYDLPIMEGFADGTFHYYCDYVGTPLVFGNSSDSDGCALALASQDANSLVAFTTGKINIQGAENPTLMVDAATFGADNFTIVAAKNGDTDNAVVLAENIEVDATGFKAITLDLSSLKDADYIMLGFIAHITNATTFDYWTGEIEEQGDAIILDNIRVLDKVANNLAIEVVAAESVQAGNSAGIMATVTNWGENVAKDYTIKITAGNEVLLQETVNEELNPFESKAVVATLKTSVLDQLGEQSVVATVDYTADEKTEDNVAETVITITEPIAPAPEGLVAEEQSDGSIDLSWMAPTGTVEFTESFEGGTGGWTIIDSDADGNSWNWSKYGETAETMDTYNGAGAIFSLSYDNENQQALTPDNWLVSPKLVLDGTFSFYAKGQDPNWCDEHFAVYVSMGDPTDPTSFTQVSEEFVAWDSWRNYTVDLSEYAGQMGYVAIRHFNVTDMFALVIDDVTYTMGGEPASYNVYYEGRQIASVEEGTAITIAADEVETGDRTFAVSAVYENGQESAPVMVTITVATDIRQIAADGSAVDIYALDGTLVRRQAKSFDGLKGVYVVNGKKVMIVR